MKKFIQNHTIPCFDTDAAWRLKPASFMNMAQEAAGQHAVHLGSDGGTGGGKTLGSARAKIKIPRGQCKITKLGYR